MKERKLPLLRQHPKIFTKISWWVTILLHLTKCCPIYLSRRKRMPIEDRDLVLVSRLGQDQDLHFFIVWILFNTWRLVREWDFHSRKLRFSSGSPKCEISSQRAKPLSGPDLVFTTWLHSWWEPQPLVELQLISWSQYNVSHSPSRIPLQLSGSSWVTTAQIIQIKITWILPTVCHWSQSALTYIWTPNSLKPSRAQLTSDTSCSWQQFISMHFFS